MAVAGIGDDGLAIGVFFDTAGVSVMTIGEAFSETIGLSVDGAQEWAIAGVSVAGVFVGIIA